MSSDWVYILGVKAEFKLVRAELNGVKYNILI